MPAPKAGAQFHFSLPGSVQGFTAEGDGLQADLLTLDHGLTASGPALALRVKGLARGRSAAALTPAFSPPNVGEMRTYDLQASPPVYPGQTVRARILADPVNTGPVAVSLRVKVYGAHDRLFSADSSAVALAPAGTAPLSGLCPISTVNRYSRLASRLPRRARGSTASSGSASAFRISQGHGTGMIIHGTREWTDHRASSEITPNMCSSFGLVARVQGLRRCYAILLEAGGFARLVKVKDGERTTLGEAEFPWSFDRAYRFSIELRGANIIAAVDRVEIRATDLSTPFNDGAIGLVIVEVEPILPIPSQPTLWA